MNHEMRSQTADNKRVKSLPEHRVRIKRPDKESVDIVVRSFSMGIDPGPIQVDESSDSIFRFKTPYFRGKATLEIPPLDFKETWIFGWIQACYDLKFVNTYGKYGYSQWSIPGLNGTLEKAISDSDGKKFPWYGIRSDEVFVLPFPTTKTHTKVVCMSDNFYPHVTWDYPGDKFESAKLTKVCRDQRFYVWLVAMNSTLRQIYVLKAAKWRMKVTVKLDPLMPLGNRTISVSGKLTPPQIFFADEKNNLTKFIPLQVLSPPSANTCQILTWVPKGKNNKGIVVIPAKRQLHHNERKDLEDKKDEKKS
ncbi:protein FAM78B-like isoform X2 [Gordionus sp. m RMFG-2023]|uniref:protein FAM78B-like isoform X2 n=1 Tax=Gordionus sp. m RMFG-2023 TaxID=3053472 RepID=UPI0031FBCF45